MRELLYKTEAALCAAFAEVVKAAGWKVYNETAGWDQLLVNDKGEQAGVQAKLRCNVDVIYQALQRSHIGPDWHCVLVGSRNHGFNDVCFACKVMVFSPDYDRRFRLDRLPGGRRSFLTDTTLGLWESMRWNPEQRHTLPAYLPDVPAGVPCPVQLTEWKIKAIRLCTLLRINGVLTRADFKAHGVNSQRWFIGKTRWLENVHGKRGVYRVVAGAKLPDEAHPEVAAQIRAEIDPSYRFVAVTEKEVG